VIKRPLLLGRGLCKAQEKVGFRIGDLSGAISSCEMKTLPKDISPFQTVQNPPKEHCGPFCGRLGSPEKN
jgi:hypothetical protein